MHYNKQCDKKRNYSCLFFPFSSYSTLFIPALFSLATISVCGMVHWTGFRMPNWIDGGVYMFVCVCVSAHIWQVIFCWLSLYFAWLPCVVNRFHRNDNSDNAFQLPSIANFALLFLYHFAVLILILFLVLFWLHIKKRWHSCVTLS